MKLLFFNIIILLGLLSYEGNSETGELKQNATNDNVWQPPKEKDFNGDGIVELEELKEALADNKVQMAIYRLVDHSEGTPDKAFSLISDAIIKIQKNDPKEVQEWIYYVAKSNGQDRDLKYLEGIFRREGFCENFSSYAEQFFFILEERVDIEDDEVFADLLYSLSFKDFDRSLELSVKHTIPPSPELVLKASSMGVKPLMETLKCCGTYDAEGGGFRYEKEVIIDGENFDFAGFAVEWLHFVRGLDKTGRIYIVPNVLKGWVRKDPETALEFVLELEELKKEQGKEPEDIALTVDLFLKEYALAAKPIEWVKLFHNLKKTEVLSKEFLFSELAVSQNNSYTSDKELKRAYVEIDRLGGFGYRKKLIFGKVNAFFSSEHVVRGVVDFLTLDETKALIQKHWKEESISSGEKATKLVHIQSQMLEAYGMTTDEITEFWGDLRGKK